MHFQAVDMTGVESVGWCRTSPARFGIVRTLLTIGCGYLLATTTILYTDIAQLKPIRYNKFLNAVEKARKQLTPQQEAPRSSPKQNTVFLRVDGEWRNVVIDKIIYVSCIKDYVMFYLDDEPKPLITHLTMKAVEQMLPSDKFLRIHRSYIVAIDKIRKIDRNDCVYIGKEIIHVPDGYQQAFQKFLETHSFNK